MYAPLRICTALGSFSYLLTYFLCIERWLDISALRIGVINALAKDAL